ncbi:RNA-binding protein sce3 like [Verticillium longisporum]|uniref:RNA-binding protein sce3 like n=1 Tax=Verticillium longisporum TaxID=100787 RepID=A0A8I3AGR7_VERLO|nr:RNA-binding protein sce3 like [Verticillium longisporum]
MAPKKKEAQKMSLGDFLHDETLGGSWADEVEDTYVVGTQALPAAERRTGYGAGSSTGWGSNERSYAPRENFGGPPKLPEKPPYTAHLGNLSYDATNDTVNEFFAGCEIISVRIIEDREQMRPKGFAYAEFATIDGLKKALELDGENFQGRTIRVKIADPPRNDGRGGDSNRDLSDWSRKGPLADLPGRGGNDRGGDFGERRGPREPREPREFAPDDGKVRDFGNWERKGPLAPAPQPERSGPREGSHSGEAGLGARSESYRGGDRRQSPATWGEGQNLPPRQEGQRAPRHDSVDRPEREPREPTAAEKDNQWRAGMRPDASKEQSRDGSEAPSSPSAAPAAAVAPAGRPKLNLAKRTVSEAPEVLSPSATSDAKASPFGAARPIDTAQRERLIEEKRLQQLQEKREADEKAKEDKRLAKEAAAKEAAEKAEEEAAKANDAQAAPEEAEEAPKEGEQADAAAAPSDEKIPIRSKGPREGAPPIKTRPSDGGNWRSASSDLKSPRGPPTGPRRGGGAPARGARNEGPRPPRANGSPSNRGPASPDAAEAPAVDADGWTTVAPVSKGRRGGRA